MSIRETLIELLLSDVPVADAFEQAEREHASRDSSRSTKFIVDFPDGVAEIPDAQCVAGQLKTKTKPTRQDILDAFAACAKKSNP